MNLWQLSTSAWQSTGKRQSFSRAHVKCLEVQDFHARNSEEPDPKSWQPCCGSIMHWASGGTQKGCNLLKDIKYKWIGGLIRAG